MARIAIEYCPRCRWLMRAAWYAQELLSTFEGALAEVALVPAGSGVFRILLDGEVLVDRAEEGFLEAKVVKQRVRDRIAPALDLGHADRKPAG